MAHERLAAMSVAQCRDEVLRLARDRETFARLVLDELHDSELSPIAITRLVSPIAITRLVVAVDDELRAAIARLGAAMESVDAPATPIAHPDSPVLLDPPEASVKAAEVYRERVLEALRLWDMRPGDTRHAIEVVQEVELP